jgi:hypothetical protein
MRISLSLKSNIFLITLLILAQNHVFSQDFFATYKSDFLDPYQKVTATPNKDDDKTFFQEQVKRINAYNPPSLQRYIAKQIVELASSDVETVRESLDAGMILIRKNWLRGKEKIDLLKKLDNFAETYQNSIKYDKKKEKSDLYQIIYQIELEIIEEFLANLKCEEARSYLYRWQQAGDNVRDKKTNNILDSEVLRINSSIENYRNLTRSLSNLKSQENSPTNKKSIAMNCLVYMFSPESALAFLEGTTFNEEKNMLLAFAIFLNNQNKIATAPTYFSERDITLPPAILFERLSLLKDFQNSANLAKEKYEKGEYQYYHHARDLTREINRHFPGNTTLDEKQLVNFFAWAEQFLKTETEKTQYFYLKQLMPKLIEAKAILQDPTNQASLAKTEIILQDKITYLEKKIGLFSFRYSAPAEEEINEKEKQWNLKNQNEKNRIIDSMQEKIRLANPAKDRVSFNIDPVSMTLRIYHESTFENLTPFKEIPFKRVNIHRCSNVTDFAFLKDSPVTQIDASHSSVKNISALKNMKSLRDLNLEHNPRIFDLSDLKGLSLTSLNIGFTSVKDLSPLKQMPLNNLTIQRTAIPSLMPLEYMPLTHLNANDCEQLKDFEGLDKTDIRILRADRCRLVKSLEPLASTPLKELYIEETLVSDLSPITKLSLSHFYFTKCPNIRSINEIAMMNIEYLGINNSQFLNHVLKFEFKLRGFRLAGTNIQDLSPLIVYTQLDHLDISECDNIKDLKTLKNQSLMTLSMNNCKSFRSFAGITDLNVKRIYANNSPLKELVSLGGSKVEKLDMRDSELIQLKGLSQCPFLIDLDVRWSKKLKDVSELESSAVETLWIQGPNESKFLETVRKMKKLKWSDIIK